LRGFEFEKRPFSPHLTLARLKQPLLPDAQQRMQHLLHSKLAGASTAIYPVNTLCVMKSELSRAGAKYTCLNESSFSKSNSPS
jgi:2'-5' RNA ligase